MDLKDRYKPQLKKLVIIGYVTSIMVYLVSINLFIKFLQYNDWHGDSVVFSTNWFNVGIIILLTLILIYIMTLLGQNIMDNDYVKLVLGVFILIFGLILFPPITKIEMMIFPLILVIGLFMISIYLLGSSIKNIRSKKLVN